MPQLRDAMPAPEDMLPYWELRAPRAGPAGPGVSATLTGWPLRMLSAADQASRARTRTFSGCAAPSSSGQRAARGVRGASSGS